MYIYTYIYIGPESQVLALVSQGPSTPAMAREGVRQMNQNIPKVVQACYRKMQRKASEKNLAFMMQEDTEDGFHYNQGARGVKRLTAIILNGLRRLRLPALFQDMGHSNVILPAGWFCHEKTNFRRQGAVVFIDCNFSDGCGNTCCHLALSLGKNQHMDVECGRTVDITRSADDSRCYFRPDNEEIKIIHCSTLFAHNLVPKVMYHFGLGEEMATECLFKHAIAAHAFRLQHLDGAPSRWLQCWLAICLVDGRTPSDHNIQKASAIALDVAASDRIHVSVPSRHRLWRQ